MTDTVVYLLALYAEYFSIRIALAVLATAFWILVVSVAYLSSAREVEGITPGFKGLLFVFVALQSMTPIRATLDLCEDCRVAEATSGGIDPYAGPERPVTKTTEDYLREAERAKRDKS
jgi:hypothetical protein